MAAKKKKAPKANECVVCKQLEGPDRAGATFTSNGDNGMIITFWMCNECAVPLGPGQGPIDMDDPTTRV